MSRIRMGRNTFCKKMNTRWTQKGKRLYHHICYKQKQKNQKGAKKTNK